MIFGYDIELFQVFVAIGAIIIVYFAWKSTEVRDLPPTALIIVENNRRRLLENITRAQATLTSDNANNGIRIGQSNRVFNFHISPPSLQDVLEEVSDLTISGGSRIFLSSSQNFPQENTQDSDPGPQEIIENMDRQNEPLNSSQGLRRRLNFFNQDNPVEENSINNETNLAGASSSLLSGHGDSAHAENCSNENNENENISKNETSQTDQANLNFPTTENENSSSNPGNNEIVIKLKYLNEDSRIVKGKPNEALGDFKRRTFTVEIEADKIVRLVFNGQVLQPDTNSLQSFGLFNNCVVHCLIHKRPNQSNTSTRTNTSQEAQNNNNNIGNNSNNSSTQQTRTQPSSSGFNFRSGLTNGPLFVYFAVGLTSIAILFCWYCRFQYSSLFSLYSTIGLIFMTALFILIFPLVILIERDVTV